MTTESSQVLTPSRAVLWDLDGTLIDTAALHWQAWREELAAHGRDLSWDEFYSMFGQRNDRTLRAWLRPDLSAEEIGRIGEAKESRFRAGLRGKGLPLVEGAAQWIETLRAAGWKQALATMAGRENVVAMFAGRQDQVFDAVVSAEQVARSKPEPDVFLRAAELLGVLPSRCVVVEDSAAGIEAARRAGMKSIGVGRQTGAADESYPTVLDIPTHAFERMIPEGRG